MARDETAEQGVRGVTDLEAAALEWIAPYAQADHLIAARDWVLRLDPGASPAMRLAALTHDMERHFPGGPTPAFADGRWDDPDYLFAHSTRSADVVQRWLEQRPAPPDPAFVAEVRRLILLHELGGDADADLLQAADSLSFLETLGAVTAGWVRDGRCTVDQAQAKLTYMLERIRLPAARAEAEPLYAAAMARVEALRTAPAA